MQRIELCSNKCCPTLAKIGDSWVINDDYGGEVTLTTEQINNLISVKLGYEKELTEKLMREGEKASQDGLFIQS